MDITSVIKIILPGMFSFLVGIGITPFVSKWLYKNKMWKRTNREQNEDEVSQAYKDIHDEEQETKTPRIGGVIVWGSVLITVMFFWLLHFFTGTDTTGKFEFVSRAQTWLPLTALIIGSIVGLIDDLMQITHAVKKLPHGFSRKQFIAVVSFFGLLFGLWFYIKLGVSQIHIPFVGYLELGFLFVPFFIATMLGMFSSGIIDGIDGLSAGVLAVMYAGFGFIAFFMNQIDIAALCMALSGGITAFLWFNVPPARFYMGETGMLGLTMTLTVIMFLTQSVLWVFVIGFPLVVTTLSSLIQVTSKKLFKKKVFKVSPLHHHFQAIGWKNEKVVMRYWIFTVVATVFAVLLAVADTTL